MLPRRILQPSALRAILAQRITSLPTQEKLWVSYWVKVIIATLFQEACRPSKCHFKPTHCPEGILEICRDKTYDVVQIIIAWHA